MARLEIGNSYSKITGLTAAQEKALREAFSYVVGGSSAYFSGFGPRRKSLFSKNGEFPTGLLHRLPVMSYETIDTRIRPKHAKLNVRDVTVPYEAQVAAVRLATAAGRGIISMPTGTGKSRVIKMLVENLYVKTLVVVPSLEIKKQLSEYLKNLRNVRIENIDSADLKNITDCDMLIIDEAHHVAAKTYQKLNKTAWKNIYYRFFLTATPYRNDTEETLLFESIAGKVIFNLTYKDAIKNKYITPVEAYYYDIPKQETDAFTYSQVYSELVVKNRHRNTIISETLQGLEKAKISALCLVREVAHGQILSEMSGLPFVHGADDESRDYIRQFNSGGIKVLIGTTGILGEGIDTKPCEYVVIAGLGKAKSHFQQQIGRAVRNYPEKESAKVILFRDASHKFLLRHFNAQRKILIDEYGIKPVKLNL